MADPLILGLLSSKRAEIAGIILDLERQIAAHRASLAHVDATLRLFDPGAKPESLAPRGVHRASALFEVGDVSGACMAAIRESAGPVGSRDIALRLMATKKMDPTDAKLRKGVQTSVRNALMSYKRRGVLESVGTGWETRWRLTEPK